MLVLSILHNIFLSKEEVDSLFEKEEIETIGVSVPVWYFEGNTSEPAEEVFCKYKLILGDEKQSISIMKNGYCINLPNLPEDYQEKRLTEKQLIKMSEDDVEKWKEENPAYINVKELLKEDKQEIVFKHFLKKKYNKRMTNLIHTVEIAKLEKLVGSLTCP